MKFMRSSKGVRLCEKWVYVKMNGIISHHSSCPRVKLSDRNHFDSSTVEKQMLLPTFQLWQEFLHSLSPLDLNAGRRLFERAGRSVYDS